MAGIIPVSGLHTNFNVNIPEIMLPINAGFTAIQKSVYECAVVGCSTIWIVANEDFAPIARKTVGEWIYDPVYYSRSKFGQGVEYRREIPIYYVPTHPKDVGRRDSYGWSVLNGINTAWRTANHISKWIAPSKYYVTFPMSVYQIEDLRQLRKNINDPKKGFFLQHNNMTILDNQPIAFTMNGEDYIQCRRNVNETTTRQYENPPPGQKYPSKKLPIEKRWSAKNFNLSDVFSKMTIDNSNVHKLDWYYDISTWENYRKYLSSENIIKKPIDALTKPHKHGNIPYSIKEEQE